MEVPRHLQSTRPLRDARSVRGNIRNRVHSIRRETKERGRRGKKNNSRIRGTKKTTRGRTVETVTIARKGSRRLTLVHIIIRTIRSI